ncbi:hypothetical protein LINPERHAP1_LOCUS15396 [Linum perenne]
MLDFQSSDISLWKDALESYPARIASLNKPDLVPLDEFYRVELPSSINRRNPNPHITTPELAKLMRWKLSRGKWRPRLLDFVSSLEEELVKSASGKAFELLPDLSKAVSALTVLKGVGPATASAILAAYSPDVAPFMSDEVTILKHNYFSLSLFAVIARHRLLCVVLFVERLWKQLLETPKNTL